MYYVSFFWWRGLQAWLYNNSSRSGVPLDAAIPLLAVFFLPKKARGSDCHPVFWLFVDDLLDSAHKIQSACDDFEVDG